MIEFACVQCGKQLRVKDEAAGEKGKCPQCRTLLQVPYPAPAPNLESASEHPPRAPNVLTVSPQAADDGHKPDTAEPRESPSRVANGPGEDQFDQPTKIAIGAGGVGLLILALSPFFKWVTFGSGGVTGIAGDGKVVLGVTVVAIVVFALAVFNRKRLASVSLGVGAWGTVSLFWMGGLIWKVGSRLESLDIEDNPFAAILATQIGPGAGLYLGLIGGILIAGSLGFLAFRKLQRDKLLRPFYVSQSVAIALGVVVAIAVGPEAATDGTRDAASFRTQERFDQWAVREIEQLRAKLAAEQNQDILSRFVVERSRFRRSNTGFSRENVIELSVRNDTGKAVSRAYFHAVLLTPGREMSWVDDDFNYEIPGGLEAGESANWKFSPNMFGSWSKVPSDRNDLVLIVRTVRLDGADVKAITSERFTEEDAERLLSLLDLTEFSDAESIRETVDARVEAVRVWRASAVRDAVRSEVEHLQSLKAKSEAAQVSMARFVVERSHFYFSKDRFSSDPFIDLTVRNDTGQTVSRFYCRGVLTSPGRETPWIDESFNYSVRGGIMPGETQQIQLAPNKFGPWSRAPSDRDDMAFATTVYRLDGAEETELYPSEFTEEEANRLEVLENIARQHGL